MDDKLFNVSSSSDNSVRIITSDNSSFDFENDFAEIDEKSDNISDLLSGNTKKNCAKRDRENSRCKYM